MFISAILKSEIHIQSWTAVLVFATGTFLWLIPVQIIDGLKFIRIQRRVLRFLYPYFLTGVQVSAFIFYLIGLDSAIATLGFSNVGLIVFSITMVFVAKLIFFYLAKYERRIRKERYEVI